MNGNYVYRCKKWCTVIGSFMVLFPAGFPWYWGNVSIYAQSYVIKYLPSSSGIEAPWVMSLFMPGCCIGIFTSAVMNTFLGKRLTLIIGITFSVAVYVVAYFTVTSSLVAMNVTMGLLTPIGINVLEGICILLSVGWSRDDSMATVTAIVWSGTTAGAIVINQFVTLYVNPNNVSPDKHVGHSRFFSQNEVVDSVPFMFLMIAFLSLGLGIVGSLLIRENKETNASCDTLSDTHYGSTGLEQQEVSSMDVAELADSANSRQAELNSSIESKNVSPRQLIRSSIFYKYSFLFLLRELSYQTLANSYKAYGQLHIRDDHFITNLSTAWLVVITMSRVIWGSILDRYGIKTSFVLYYSGSAVTMLCVYFSIIIHKWCYVIIILASGCFASHLFSIFSFVALKSFGESHYLFNFGLLVSPTLIINIGVAPLFEYLLGNFGWFYVFGFCSFCNVLAVIVNVVDFSTDGQK